MKRLYICAFLASGFLYGQSPVIMTWNGSTITWNGTSMSWSSSSSHSVSVFDSIPLSDIGSTGSCTAGYALMSWDGNSHTMTWNGTSMSWGCYTGLLSTVSVNDVLLTNDFAIQQHNSLHSVSVFDTEATYDTVARQSAHYATALDLPTIADSALAFQCLEAQMEWDGNFMSWNSAAMYWGCATGMNHLVNTYDYLITWDKSPLTMNAGMVWPEGIEVSDPMLQQGGHARFPSEVITAADIGLEVSGHGRTSIDALPPDIDSASPFSAHYAMAKDTTYAYDFSNRLTPKLAQVSDTLLVSESIARLTGLHTNPIDTVPAIESLASSHGQFLSLADFSVSADLINKGISTSSLDSLNQILDSLTPRTSRVISANDVLLGIDTALGIPSGSRHYILSASDFNMLVENGTIQINAIIPIVLRGNIVIYLKQNTEPTYQPTVIIVVKQ